jgi:hypothetical protein
VIKSAASCRFSPVRTHNSILFRGEKAAPFRVGMSNFKRLASHCPSLLRGSGGEPHTSKFATRNAFSCINSRRGSTTSPINLTKISSASSASLILTCSSDRASLSSIVFPKLIRIHFTEAFIALHLGNSLLPSLSSVALGED